MSDLSWLNPTPHAIAVYASRLLSPVAAQHSLPSGRYSLLGPDFHRLDRTSLRLAHSFGHLVGAGRPPSSERSFWNGPVLSFEPDASLTDDRDPAVVVGLDDPTEPIRRNLHQLAANSLETLLEIGHGLRDRLLETSDRGRWRTGRGE